MSSNVCVVNVMYRFASTSVRVEFVDVVLGSQSLQNVIISYEYDSSKMQVQLQ